MTPLRWVGVAGAVLLLVWVIFLLTRAQDSRLTVEPTPSVATSAGEPATEEPPDDPTVEESASGTPETEAPPGPASAGIVTVDGTPILPIPDVGLAEFAGGSAEGQSVPVQSVVSDEGFWVGTSEVERLFVFLDIGGSESLPQIRVGAPISISGTLEPVPVDPETDFAVRAEDGLDQLVEQGYYLRVLSVAAG